MGKTSSDLRGALLDLDVYVSYIEDVTTILCAEDFETKREELVEETENLFLFTTLYLPTFLRHAEKEGVVLDLEPICAKIRAALTEFRAVLWSRLEHLDDEPELLGRLTSLAQQNMYSEVIEYQYRAKIAKLLREMRSQAQVGLATLSQETNLSIEHLELVEKGMLEIPSPSEAWHLDRALLRDDVSVGPLATLVYEYHANLESPSHIELAGKIPKMGVLTE